MAIHAGEPMAGEPTKDPGAYSNVEYVFEPHSTALPDIRSYVAALWERRPFMMELARSDLRSTRTSTSLGSIWSVLDPLFQGGIYFFLYTVIRGGGSGGANRTFLPVLIAGFFLFSLSLSALGDAGQSIKRSKGLMLNSTFPRAMLPVTSVYKSLLKFIPMFCVLVVLFPLVGGKIGPGIFLLPILFVIQIFIDIGIALCVATLVTLIPDGTNAMNYVNRVLFFATPVVYPVTLLPASAKAIIGWQPLFALFASYQAVFRGGTPSFFLILQAALWAVGLVTVGGNLFLRHEREFALHL
jgi:teichoic acid transport system permease protein